MQNWMWRGFEQRSKDCYLLFVKVQDFISLELPQLLTGWPFLLL